MLTEETKDIAQRLAQQALKAQHDGLFDDTLNDTERESLFLHHEALTYQALGVASQFDRRALDLLYLMSMDDDTLHSYAWDESGDYIVKLSK